MLATFLLTFIHHYVNFNSLTKCLRWLLAN